MSIFGRIARHGIKNIPCIKCIPHLYRKNVDPRKNKNLVQGLRARARFHFSFTGHILPLNRKIKCGSNALY